MLHPGALSQKSFKKNIYLFLFKLFKIHKFCAFHATTAEEKNHIQKIFGIRTKVFVAQNFPRIFTNHDKLHKQSGVLNLVSIALISPMKNHLVVINALMKCQGYISYNIYGPVKDQAYWDICLERIKKLPPNIIVNHHGDILPREVEKALAKNDVFVMPSKSENFGHALYEALTAGKPIITSHNTPWNNLKIANAGINVAPENEEELVNAIQYFTSMNHGEFMHWNEGANRYALEAINIDDIKNQYKQMFLI